jgi:outer membrane protein assembly factor BamE (lipoprotein component of BamABCDE complex)
MNLRRGARGGGKAAAVLVLAAVAGCHSAQYIVVADRTPLYRDAQGGDVVATMPRYHHEDLDEEPDAAAARVHLTFAGQAGWADRAAVRVFDYLDPALDGGADREKAVKQQLRELQLADLGKGWSPDDVAAIRKEEVLVGMTKTQVEVAWGWPVTVEPSPTPGGERWVYRDARVSAVRRWGGGGGAFDAWGASSGWLGREDWRGYPTWVTVRVPVTVERVVEFDPDGRVVRVHVRRYIDDAGSS